MTIIFRLIWPYLLRYAMNRGADYTANFLQVRRERRAQPQVEPEIIESSLPEEAEVDTLTEILCPPPTSKSFLAGDAFWFTLSGILLGTAISIALSYIVRQDD